MRVTIEHREKAAGITGAKRHYFVDCTVEFSEEEKAIIKQRGLGDQFIEMESAIPTGSGISDYTWANAALRLLSRLLVLGGVAVILYNIATNALASGTDVEPGYFFIAAFATFVFRKLAERRSDASYAERRITLRDLLNTPSFSAYASNPAFAQGLEANIREQLVGLKNIMTASAEVPKKQTFEL